MKVDFQLFLREAAVGILVYLLQKDLSVLGIFLSPQAMKAPGKELYLIMTDQWI